MVLTSTDNQSFFILEGKRRKHIPAITVSLFNESLFLDVFQPPLKKYICKRSLTHLALGSSPKTRTNGHDIDKRADNCSLFLLTAAMQRERERECYNKTFPTIKDKLDTVHYKLQPKMQLP